MAAPKGNRFWEARSSHGRKPKFATPEILWNACTEYFTWVEKNPLKEEKLFCFQGKVSRASVSKMRAMTISGLCLFLDIDHSTWREYRKAEDFSTIVTRVEEVIYNQKFSGAAAELLNANIIARDLGLRDKRDLEFPDENGKPQKIGEAFSDTERAARLLFLLEQAEKRSKGDE